MTFIESLPIDEAERAQSWWAGQKLRRTWTRGQARHDWLAEAVVAHEPTSVLEFGCAAGGNLRAIRARRPAIRLLGLDVNPTSTRHGRQHWNLDLRLDPLDSLADDGFDLAFTVSVLDHIPDIGDTLDQLCRVSPLLLLVEPWLGREGKVDSSVITGTSPFSYSHDYPSLLRERGYAVRIEQHPLSDWGLGPYYRLYTARRRQ